MSLKRTLGIMLVAVGLFGVGQQLLRLNAESHVSASVQTALSTDRKECVVIIVYDGDTIGCDFNHNRKIEKPAEEVRLLGIDTPEMHYSSKNKSHGTDHETDEPFAKEASHLTESLVAHKTVYLAFDQVRTDKYGRTLAHVYLTPTDTESVSEKLLRAGVATVFIIPPNLALQNKLLAAEAEAAINQKGLWRDKP